MDQRQDIKSRPARLASRMAAWRVYRGHARTGAVAELQSSVDQQWPLVFAARTEA
jgi:hypothetical protein